MRDYVQIAIDYATDAIKDKKREKYCKLIRQAAKRFLDDLKRADKKNCPFFFDEWHAKDACDFLEKLPHAKGNWDPPTIVLHPSHIFFVVQLFGFRKKTFIKIKDWADDDKFYPRRFSSALFAVARKNAKSTLSAGILLYCLCCEPENGAEVISAATTFPQARIIFDTAKIMVEKTFDMREAFGLECWSKSISRFETNSSFKPIHAKASTQDGLNPSHIGIDEIHAHKTADLLNVLQSALGARANPLILYTTTEGYVNAGPWQEIRKFAQDLLKGSFKDEADHFLVVFYALDDDDEELNPESWIKASPFIDINPYLLDEIKKAAIEAKQMPSKMAEFRIKRLNKPSSAADIWIDLRKWDKCDGQVDLEFLKDYPCYGGLDLASTSDLTSLSLTWNIDGEIYTYNWGWCPTSAISYRTERGTVPYAGWVEKGYIKQTEGDVTDYTVIESDILELFNKFNIVNIAYDSWNAQTLVNNLVAENVPMIQFIQGTKSYHPAMQATEIYYVSGKLHHGGNPVLRWCASNMVARRDPNLNMAPDKKKSADKIDYLVSMLMSIGVMIADIEDNEDEDIEAAFKDVLII
ncbi:terminase large subunit [Gilliamella sp. Bif1-4]|uniref:terminase large subunit n=1 Tax=Gilliamella sp. Bif1-4 TaxID=3120233 RepID=UPI00080D9051|nr:terminase TerL endonuclease subunit [Gilliamella apicola]OCG39733.1 terminase [Gilliamella apicola]